MCKLCIPIYQSGCICERTNKRQWRYGLCKYIYVINLKYLYWYSQIILIKFRLKVTSFLLTCRNVSLGTGDLLSDFFIMLLRTIKALNPTRITFFLTDIYSSRKSDEILTSISVHCISGHVYTEVKVKMQRDTTQIKEG